MKSFAGTQQGAALFVSLVLLLVLTVLAISSMRGTVLQEQMVSAQRDAQVAFEGAEHAMREAEEFLRQAALPTFENKNGLYKSDGTPPTGAALFASSFWVDANTKKASMPKSGDKELLAEEPRYFIQVLDPTSLSLNSRLNLNMQNYANDSGDTTVYPYRIVARSTGISGQSARVIEQYFVREQ